VCDPQGENPTSLLFLLFCSENKGSLKKVQSYLSGEYFWSYSNRQQDEQTNKKTIGLYSDYTENNIC